ncbi:MAG TPA: helix-turn-helix transcriptional regulator [Streptosporangiaceae bacterium]|nr:helix-turn-helix transcriptional regulator [Streptosporangiaceae bacterium]
MDDRNTIGARLRTLRRWRGKTQAELAGLAGLSPSFVSMVESGQRPLDRRSHIAALASALKVSETDLVGGPHLTPDPMQSDPHMGIPSLRVALQTNTLTTAAVDRARPLSDLAQIVTGKVAPLYRACDYVTLGGLLPDVLDELHHHVAEPADEAAHQLALETLVEACVAAAFTAKDLNYNDLAHLAARRALEAASLLDDPISLGKANFVWLHTLPRAGSLDRNMAAAEWAANTLEPYAHDLLGLSVLGLLTLTASLTAASLQQGDKASHWLDEATSIAARVPDEPAHNWQSFSTTNVNVWRVTVGVERGETGGTVRELAQQVSLARLDVKSRRADFLADVGRGLAREPQMKDEAARWLHRAEETAPQRIRNSAPAREAVAYLLNRAVASAGGRDLRGMAARMGLPH